MINGFCNKHLTLPVLRIFAYTFLRPDFFVFLKFQFLFYSRVFFKSKRSIQKFLLFRDLKNWDVKNQYVKSRRAGNSRPIRSKVTSSLQSVINHHRLSLENWINCPLRVGQRRVNTLELTPKTFAFLHFTREKLNFTATRFG